MRSPFTLRTRDDNPNLVMSELTEASIAVARYRKAVRLADLLEAEGVTWDDSENMDERAWELTIRAAGLKSASVVSRVLSMEVLRDREERRQRD